MSEIVLDIANRWLLWS